MTNISKMSDVFYLPLKRYDDMITDSKFNLDVRSHLHCSTKQLDIIAGAVNAYDQNQELIQTQKEKLESVWEYATNIPLHLPDENSHGKEHILHFVDRIANLAKADVEPPAPAKLADTWAKNESTFLSLFTKVESLEDCPLGIDLLVWDGCDFSQTYVDFDCDTGCYYDANYPEEALSFIAYLVLPDQDKATGVLGDGE